MNSGRNDCQRISRRVVLTGTALALGAAAAATVVPFFFFFFFFF